MTQGRGFYVFRIEYYLAKYARPAPPLRQLRIVRTKGKIMEITILVFFATRVMALMRNLIIKGKGYVAALEDKRMVSVKSVNVYEDDDILDGGMVARRLSKTMTRYDTS